MAIGAVAGNRHLWIARQAWLLLLSGALLGCDVLGVGTPNVEGEWLLTARNLTSGSDTCSIDVLRLDLQQTRSRFSGTASSTTVACILRDTLRTFSLPQQPVVAGELADSTVTFFIAGRDWRLDGVIAGESMTGSMTVRFGPPISTARFVGPFGAARLPATQATRLQRARFQAR
ncbi:MAG: hypothetical protein ACT4O1_01775 [Gemmatimonadota bacterium]